MPANQDISKGPNVSAVFSAAGAARPNSLLIVPDVIVMAEHAAGSEQGTTASTEPAASGFVQRQRQLLTEPLLNSWAGPGDGCTFVAMSCPSIFFSVKRQPLL